jgi:hypothetical protein
MLSLHLTINLTGKKCIMITIEKIISKIEKKGIEVNPYTENEVLCGYELNTYTDGGVNEIIFLDFRDNEKSAHNVNDFIEEFTDYMNYLSIDERIELNRQNVDYKRDFTLKQSIKDFTKWEKSLNKLIKKLTKKYLVD